MSDEAPAGDVPAAEEQPAAAEEQLLAAEEGLTEPGPVAEAGEEGELPPADDGAALPEDGLVMEGGDGALEGGELPAADDGGYMMPAGDDGNMEMGGEVVQDAADLGAVDEHGNPIAIDYGAEGGAAVGGEYGAEGYDGDFGAAAGADPALDENGNPVAIDYGADGAAADAGAYGADGAAVDAGAYGADAGAGEYGADAGAAGGYGAEAGADGGYGAVDGGAGAEGGAYGGYDAAAGGYDAGDAYGGYNAGAGASHTGGEDARALADKLVAEEREKHGQALKLEAKAREELEDMILRIEKHFKAEQAARKKAEELLQASIAAEMDAKARADEVLKKRAAETRLLEEERAAIKRERAALEAMRQEFESELQAARSEVARAQDALAGSEERIRAAEQVERARLEAEYQARLATLAQELDRTREEAGYRMLLMSEEMEKWRQTAAMTANAVMEAKTEVQERKRELDNTKEKMDRLLDKLYIGRERGIELSGAIASNQRMMSFLPGMANGPMGSLFLPQQGMGMGMGQGHGAGGMGGPKGPPMAAWGAGPSHVKLPPIKQQQQSVKGGGMGGYGSGDEAGGVRRAASSGNLADPYGSPGGYNATSRSDGQQSPPGMRKETSPGRNQYAHVQSKFAQGAEEVAVQARQAKSARTRGKQANKKPDRFAEAERENARIGGMAKRWQ